MFHAIASMRSLLAIQRLQDALRSDPFQAQQVLHQLNPSKVEAPTPLLKAPPAVQKHSHSKAYVKNNLPKEKCLREVMEHKAHLEQLHLREEAFKAALQVTSLRLQLSKSTAERARLKALIKRFTGGLLGTRKGLTAALKAA